MSVKDNVDKKFFGVNMLKSISSLKKNLKKSVRQKNCEKKFWSKNVGKKKIR